MVTPLLALFLAAVTEPVPPALVAVKAAHLIDGNGGAPIANAVVLIEGDHIKAVGPGLAVPAGARVIDLGAATLLPGLIDAHVHLTGRADMHGYRALGISLPKAALDGAVNAGRTLRAGFTTVRNVGAEGFADVRCATRSTRAGCRVRACSCPARPSASRADTATTTCSPSIPPPLPPRASRTGRMRRGRRCGAISSSGR